MATTRKFDIAFVVADYVPPPSNFVEIPLTNSKLKAVIDKKHETAVKKLKWLLQPNGHVFSTRKLVAKKQVLLHRYILILEGIHVPPKMEVDHIDRDPRNNRIKNLRVVTTCENQHNVGLNKKNKSGFKGVCWDNQAKKWRGYLHFNGKQKHLGFWQTPEMAAHAYNFALKGLPIREDVKVYNQIKQPNS